MRDRDKIIIILILSLILGLVIMSFSEKPKTEQLINESYRLAAVNDIKSLYERVGNLEINSISYDSNDPIFKFIPEAPRDWREKFGDSERTRLIHIISELRVALALQGKRLQELEKDPNNATRN